MKLLLISDDFSEVNFFKALFARLSLDYEVSNNPKLIGGLLLTFNPEVIVISAKSKKFDALKTVTELRAKSKNSKYVILKTMQTQIDDRYSIVDFLLDSPTTASQLVNCLVSLGADREKLEGKLQTDASAKSSSDKTVVSGSSSQVDNEVQVVKGGTQSEDIQVISGSKEASEKTFISGDANAPEGVENVAGGSATADGGLHIEGENQQFVKDFVSHSTSTSKAIDVDEKDRTERYKKIVSTLEPIDTKTHLSSEKISEAQKQLKLSTKSDNFDELNQEKRKFVEVLFTAEDED